MLTLLVQVSCSRYPSVSPCLLSCHLESSNPCATFEQLFVTSSIWLRWERPRMACRRSTRQTYLLIWHSSIHLRHHPGDLGNHAHCTSSQALVFASLLRFIWQLHRLWVSVNWLLYGMSSVYTPWVWALAWEHSIRKQAGVLRWFCGGLSVYS